MNEFWSTQTAFWIGFGGLLLAALVVVVTILYPGPPKLPMSRRRPGVETPATPLAAATASATGTIARLMEGRAAKIRSILRRAGVRNPISEVVLMLGSATLAAAAVGLLLRGAWAAVLLAVAVPLVTRVVLEYLIRRRRQAFGDQLEETLQMLATGLRSGYGLMQALAAVASESAEPTKDELTRVINENRVGRPLTEALTDASLRMSNEDFFWVTEAIAINREVGGNLADVLDGIGQTIRERAQLRRQVRALSAEGRLSAYVLIGLPFAIAGMLVGQVRHGGVRVILRFMR